jgi:hypothetical protein
MASRQRSLPYGVHRCAHEGLFLTQVFWVCMHRLGLWCTALVRHSCSKCVQCGGSCRCHSGCNIS